MIVSMVQHHSSHNQPEQNVRRRWLIYMHRDKDGVDRRRQGMEIREADVDDGNRRGRRR